MNHILEVLFGKKPKNTCQIKPTFKTTNPPQRLPYNEWCKEFKVGLLWNREHLIHIE